MLNRNLRKSLLFVLFSLLLSGAALAVTHFTEVRALYVIILAYFIGPAISAFLVEKIMSNENPLKTLDINFVFNLWSISAIVAPLALLPLAFGVGLLMPETSIAQARFDIMAVIKSVLVGGTVLAIIAFFAVVGFAGLLFKELVYLGFWRSSYITGIFAALWLAPLLYMMSLYDAAYTLKGLVMILPFVIAVFPVLTFFKCKTKNIFVPSIMTGIIFATAAFPFDLIFGGEVLLLGYNGVAGILAASIIAAIIFVYNRFLTEAYKRIY